MAGLGWGIAQYFGLAGAPIVGPMVVSGIAHALGLTTVRLPLELLIVAQIGVGVLLGCQFRGLTFKEFTHTMVWGLLNAAVLLAVTAVVVILVSRITGFDQVSVLMAFAPGGQTELNLLAFVLGVDVAYVALHHLARLAIVILGAQLVFKTQKSWRQDGS
jgi:membrane AbrB-like protein